MLVCKLTAIPPYDSIYPTLNRTTIYVYLFLGIAPRVMSH
jgi:hypothetical protein